MDTVEILKGEFLTDDEYFKAAVLGWGVELVRFSSRYRGRMKTLILLVAGLFPRCGRYDGWKYHAKRPSVLV